MSFNKRYKHNSQIVLQILAMLFLGVIAAFFVLTAGPLQRGLVKADGTAPAVTNSLEGYTPTKVDASEYFNTISGAAYDKDSNPYAISTADDLRTLAYFVNSDFTIINADDAVALAENQGFQSTYTLASFQLTNHIDLSAWTQWEPIGTTANPFSGSLNGAGHSIYGLTIIDDMTQASIKSYAGLFGSVSYYNDDVTESCPVIQRLGLKDTVIQTKRTYVGSFVGYALGAEPANYGEENIPTISLSKRSYVNEIETVGTTDVTRQYSAAQASLVIQDCYNTGYVEGGNNVGGIVGKAAYGVVIFNCYNSTSATNQYNQVADVYSSIETANVGGIVGSYIVPISTTSPVIRNTLSTVRVSKYAATANSENIGYIIGQKPEGVSSSVYLDYNLYLMYETSYANDTNWAYGCTLTDLTASAAMMFSQFNLTTFSSGKWSNDCSTVWCVESNTNRGIPVLTNVPQLVKFNFKVVEVQDEQEIEVDDTEAKAGIANDARQPALTPADGSGLLYEQGQDVIVATDVIKAEKYEFSKWKYSYSADSIVNSVYEFSPTDGTASFESMKASALHDCTLVSILDYTTYSIKLAVSNADKYSSLLVNGEEYIVDSTEVTAKYTDEISFQVNTVAGWEVVGWTDGMNQTNIASNTYSLKVADYVDGVTSAGNDIPTTINVQALLGIKNYNIQIVSSNDTFGSISAKNTDDTDFNQSTIQYGSVINLTATAVDQFHIFHHWSITVGGEEKTLDNPHSSTLRFEVEDGGDIIITAVFDKISYAVQMSAGVVGGSAEVTSATISATDSATFYYDEVVVITANESEGYEFVGFKVNNELISSNSTAIIVDIASKTLTLNLTEIADAVTYEPVFEALTYAVIIQIVDEQDETLSNAADITVSALTPANPSGEFVYNTAVIYDITLANGIDYVGVSSADCDVIAITDANGLPTQIQFTILKDTTIKVVLKRHLYLVDVILDVQADNGLNFETSCVTGAGNYYYDDLATISIAIPSMFDFVRSEGLNVTLGGGSSVNVLDYNLNGQTLTFARKVTTDMHFTAKFCIKTTTIKFAAEGDENGQNWFTVDGVSSLVPIAREYGKSVIVSVSNEYLTARSGMYKFSHWEINNVPVSTAISMELVAKGNEMTVKAVFIPVDIKVSVYTAKWNEQTGIYDLFNEAGSIEGLNANIYKYGDIISLTALANEGYRFAGWYKKDDNTLGRGTLMTTSNTISSLRVDQVLNLYANFESVSTVTIQMSDLNAGRVTGAGEYVNGSRVTLIAEAGEGYRFVKWTSNDINASYDAIYHFNIRGDVVYNAVFEPIFTVSAISSNSDYGKILGNTSGTYNDTITLQAVSENNCTFIGWVINDVVVSTADEFTMNLSGDVEVRALFKKNFDWNILIILAGCVLFAIVLIAGSAAYIKMKEAEPMPVRALINGKDDKDVLIKAQKRDKYRDKIEPVPTRKNTKANVAPIPVRKISVAAVNHKGEVVGKSLKATEQKPTLKTEENIVENKVVENVEPKTTQVKQEKTIKTPTKQTKSKKNKKPSKHKKVNQR